MSLIKKFSFKHIDRLKGLSNNTKNTAKVGFFGGDKHPNTDLLIAEVAAINEYGGGNTPERAFMRKAFKHSSNKKHLIQKIAKAIIAGNISMDAGLDTVGRAMTNDLKKSIRQFSQPSNTPSTIAKKGFNNPLIETGAMLRNAKYTKINNA